MPKPFGGKSIVLGVTGGIACYKSLEIVSRLVKLGAELDVIMTKNAMEFVTPLSFQTLSKRPCVYDTFKMNQAFELEHISLAKKASLFIVAPATANIIAKMAHGIADDMLSTTLLATRAQIAIAPAMNENMLLNPATQENLEALKKRGVHIIEPASGLLACGDIGRGRMAEPCDIVSELEYLLTEKDLQGLNVLVSAGASIEEIDPVRYISNYSSGKMGYALANRAYMRGARVCLVSGKSSERAKNGVEIVNIKSTESLKCELLSRAEASDIIIQAAAPCDFRPSERRNTKIKKDGSGKMLLELIENDDIARLLGQRRREKQLLIGFAAETGDLIENARKKLKSKGLDFIVANDVTKKGAGFESETNIASIISENSVEDFEIMPKPELADIILDRAKEALNKK